MAYKRVHHTPDFVIWWIRAVQFLWNDKFFNRGKHIINCVE